MSIIKLNPAFKDYLWGGTKLKENYGKKTDMDPVAESWELSVHPDGPSIVASGEYEGLSFPEYLEKKLNEWYKEKAIFHFEELLDSSLEKFNKYKIEKPILDIRLMQKRWGSCTKSGKIILNTELIKAPKGSIEYVVIHELCHLVHHNHNKEFYDLQNRLSPDWKKWKEKLEQTLS